MTDKREQDDWRAAKYLVGNQEPRTCFSALLTITFLNLQFFLGKEKCYWRTFLACCWLPVQIFSVLQSYCSHLLVGLLPYDSRSTLIRLVEFCSSKSHPQKSLKSQIYLIQYKEVSRSVRSFLCISHFLSLIQELKNFGFWKRKTEKENKEQGHSS